MTREADCFRATFAPVANGSSSPTSKSFRCSPVANSCQSDGRAFSASSRPPKVRSRSAWSRTNCIHAACAGAFRGKPSGQEIHGLQPADLVRVVHGVGDIAFIGPDPSAGPVHRVHGCLLVLLQHRGDGLRLLISGASGFSRSGAVQLGKFGCDVGIIDPGWRRAFPDPSCGDRYRVRPASPFPWPSVRHRRNPAHLERQR
jgi:hypothetical protein